MFDGLLFDGGALGMDLPIAAEEPGTAAATPLKVSLQLVNTLMNNVGELVLARNQLRSVDSDDPAVQADIRRNLERQVVQYLTNDTIRRARERTEPWMPIQDMLQATAPGK